MNPRPYSDRDVIVFAAKQTIDTFSLWIPIVLIQFLSVVLRLAGLLLLIGMAAKSFFGTSLNYPLLQTSLFDFSRFWVSVVVFVIACVCCIVFEIIGGIFDMGIMRIRLDMVAGDATSLSRILTCGNLAFKHFVATLLYWAAVVIGLILFIVPGIILGIRFGFYRAVMVETGCGPIAALKQSFDMTRGLFLTLLLTVVVRLALVLPFLRTELVVLTYFLVFPFLWLSQAFIYRALRRVYVL